MKGLLSAFTVLALAASIAVADCQTYYSEYYGCSYCGSVGGVRKKRPYEQSHTWTVCDGTVVNDDWETWQGACGAC